MTATWEDVDQLENGWPVYVDRDAVTPDQAVAFLTGLSEGWLETALYDGPHMDLYAQGAEIGFKMWQDACAIEDMMPDAFKNGSVVMGDYNPCNRDDT